MAYLGDSITVKHVPLINALDLSSNNPALVLDTNHFSKHMAEGRKKYVPYIADIFINRLRFYDPTKQLVDLVFFGGDSNVQK